MHGIVGDFERDLAAIPAGESRVIAFLGSTIGNLYPERRATLLRAIAAAMAPGDSFLLGIDLVKDPARHRARVQRLAGRDGAVRPERPDGGEP